MPDPVLTQAIDKVASGRDLSVDEAAQVLEVIMAGDASEVQIAGLLIALRTKGETIEELAGLARTMRALAAPVCTSRKELVDTAGTGGGRPTFNVSTTAALIAAGVGCAVAKHGNRSATGRSGSADVLEALGVRIDLAAGSVGTCIDELGFGFMFAPRHHQATRFVVPVRKELAVRTIFNFLGPLTNPACARRQLIGVSDPAYVEKMAGALALLGVDRALVVSSQDALDEMSISAPTTVVEVDGADLRTYTVRPEDCGLSTVDDPDAVSGGSPDDNAATTRAIFAGEPGPRRDIAVLNAGAAIYAAGRADDLAAGVEAAQAAIDDGSALRTLDAFVARTQQLAAAAAAEDRPGVNVLERIVAGTREDVRRRRAEIPLAALESALAGRGDDRPFSEALTLPGVSVIAEHKRRSPSAGEIRAGASVAGVVLAYERGGAAAISILTEGTHFGGSLDDLREARAASALPILRKDFIVDAYQLYESAAAGADAILLIVAALDARALAELHGEALTLDLDVLVEVHDEEELDCALEVLDADVIGINNRNLVDFSVDIERTFALLADIPAGKTVVSESGFHSRDQLDALERVGVDGVLIGESLMRAPNPEAALRTLTGGDDGDGLPR